MISDDDEPILMDFGSTIKSVATCCRNSTKKLTQTRARIHVDTRQQALLEQVRLPLLPSHVHLGPKLTM